MRLVTRASLAALFLLCLAGCPAADGSNNTSEDMPATDMPTSDMCTNNCEDAGDMGMTDRKAPSTYEAKYQMRFESLAFTNTREPVFRILNGLLKMNFDQSLTYPVVVLLDFKDVDADAGTFQLRAGSGLKTMTDGEYAWDPDTADTYYEGMLTKETGAFVGNIDRFVFVATFETETDPERTELPLNELTFTGNMSVNDQNEVVIENGLLKGHIKKSEADNTMVVIPGAGASSLTSLLKEENINYDSDGDNTNDSWLLEATFKAIPTIIK